MLARCCKRAEDPNAIRVVHGSSRGKNNQLGYTNNRVTNTKYTWWNFLPLNLFNQFSLHLNRYFLFIAILQLFEVLTPVNPATTWGPMVVIFAISAIKELVDDCGRRRQDQEFNEAMYDVVSSSSGYQLQRMRSEEIEVGDIVCIRDGETIPCDLCLLKSSGDCWVQTANLDGETNLKPRYALPQTQEMKDSDIESFTGVVACHLPNNDIKNFDSRLWLDPSPGNDIPVDDGTQRSKPLSLSGT